MNPVWVSLSAQGLRTLLQLAALVGLARWVEPEAFGAMGLVCVLHRFLDLFKGGGLAHAWIQGGSEDPLRESALFWVTVLLSLLLAGVHVALGPLMAWFFGQPILTPLCAAMGGVMLAGGLGTHARARLQRKERFVAWALCETLGAAIGVGLGLWAAVQGAGVWALVLYPLGHATAETLLFWCVDGWKPHWVLRGTGLRPLLRYGAGISTAALLRFLVRNVDSLWIGRGWGAAVLGQYNRAQTLALLPVSQACGPLGSVLLPQFSRAHERCDGSLDRMFIGWRRVLFWGTLGLSAVLVLLGGRLTALLLGPGWEEAGRLLSLMAYGVVLQPVSELCRWRLMAEGRTRVLWRTEAATVGLVLGGMLLGSPFGASGIAAGCAAAWTVSGILLLWVTRVGPALRAT